DIGDVFAEIADDLPHPAVLAHRPARLDVLFGDDAHANLFQSIPARVVNYVNLTVFPLFRRRFGIAYAEPPPVAAHLAVVQHHLIGEGLAVVVGEIGGEIFSALRRRVRDEEDGAAFQALDVKFGTR